MLSSGLPGFGLDEYRDLLVALRGRGYSLLPVSRMADAEAGAAYLRHDIDIHLWGVEEMARVEAACGARATYYVCLTQPYNPLSVDGRRVLAGLRGMGHEIGLHYDLETYPADPAERRAHLDWELAALGRAAGAPIRTLCMHQPYRGQPDPFRELEGLLHPHDPRLQEGLLYVSDSCRAWRDTSLLRCLGEAPPARLLLNTHPEVWLDGACADRM
ncbi:MAG TPA: hypothetical protein VFT45_04970, partial [Longimicrobium sp.]|nr:hypothetical protein [Longimicrobium sp.]